ncbi:hypothetical protein PMI01_03980 [Caulobacter sp. AP07]|uniref:hypothetical protein n=1 Tax=Caulobacter sp. AP07 TaxID=1144304 RepID=UPI00027220A6|nr:hypothetical protein [Caulobacter sp. AP07]EJL27066.1 hypothetical protein PMI01_03980 [Caulobacter sp. AP07]
MSDLALSTKSPRRLGRSVVAVVAGFATVVVLSIATDAVLHALKVYPPPEQGLHDPLLNLLALAYRGVFTVAGGWVTARLAPSAPLRHAFILGVLGLVAGTAGAVASWNLNLGPHWYPIALAASGLPLCWLGGVLATKGRAA